MKMVGRSLGFIVLVSVVLAGLALGPLAQADDTSHSAHYQVTQTELGGSSTLQNCSASYCARSSTGTNAADSGGSSTDPTGTSATGSQQTQAQPALSVAVTAGGGDLGNLSTQTTATQSVAVAITNRLSNGYVLQIVGAPPHIDGHTLATPSTPTVSQPGVEQFGINAVANTSPTIGANLVQKPSSTTSHGVVANNYDTANEFMYSDGDTVAYSQSASGETDYTISMIINIATATPAGHYSSDFAMVVVPVY